MKIPVLAIGSAVVGVGLGVLCGFWQFGPLVGDVAMAAARGSVPAATTAANSPSGPQPVVHVAEATFEFGSMESGTSQDHDFVFENKGDAPLVLNQISTSCKCTLSDVPNKQIPPGQSAVVTLEWKAETGPGEFRQTAVIGTNDPRRSQVVLTVHGSVTDATTVEPADLIFSNVSASASATAEVRIFAHHVSDFQILSHRFENQETAANFEAAFEPVTAEELKSHKAKSGMVVKVTAKPGLPLGPIQQKIVLESSIRTAKIEVAISGLVTSDISVVGPDWSQSLALLKLGRVDSRTGASRNLKLFTRGEHHRGIEFKVVKVDPPNLQVVLGERTEINNGTVSTVPITIRIPQGTPNMSRLGSKQGKLGEVLLETNHPVVRTVRLQIQFAVENQIGS